MDEAKEKIIIEVEDSEFQEEQAKKATIRVLAFSLGSENYCVEIKQAKEVVKVGEVTRVPNVPDFILGVMNLRGEVIVLCDIKYFLGLEQKERTKEARALITDVTGSVIGVLLDNISEAQDIEEEAIQPPLATLNEKLIQFTKGQIQKGDDIMILLDLEKILHCEEIQKLKKETEDELIH